MLTEASALSALPSLLHSTVAGFQTLCNPLQEKLIHGIKLPHLWVSTTGIGVSQEP